MSTEIIPLYPAQQRIVEGFAGLPVPRRRILNGPTGVGKTPMGIRAACSIDYQRILVITVSSGVPHWVSEWARWGDGRARGIPCGRTVKLSKSKAAIRDEAYISPVVVVSYSLIKHVDTSPWDLIILDEGHRLAQPQAKWSKEVAKRIKLNYKADVWLMTATLIPTEVSQLWHPLHLLFPHGGWGAPTKSGDVSFTFKQRYCDSEEEPYALSGRRYFGLRKDREGELRERLAKVTDTITRADIRADQPPLDVNLRMVEGEPRKAVLDLLDDLGSDVTHRVVVCYHHDVANELHAALPGSALMTGTTPSAERFALLAALGAAPAATLVVTSECIRESVRLMWAQKVYYVEFRTSPVQVIQSLGRFQSVGSDARPSVEILANHDSKPAARLLVRRVRAIMGSGLGGAAEAQTESLFQLPDMSESEFSNRMKSFLSRYEDKSDWEDSDGDEW